jgi:hypothetical protein
LLAPGFLLYGAEFVEEIVPFDAAVFAAFEPVGPVEARGAGGGLPEYGED